VTSSSRYKNKIIISSISEKVPSQCTPWTKEMRVKEKLWEKNTYQTGNSQYNKDMNDKGTL